MFPILLVFGLGAFFASKGKSLPSWHHALAPFLALPRVPTSCPIDCDPESPTFGYAPCPPETLRARAEAWLTKNGYWKGRLPMDVYALARNIATEQGHGSREDKMAVALSTMGQARRGIRGRTVTDVVLHSDRRLFGPIHPEKSCKQPGATGANLNHRWTASSNEPTVLDVVVASAALRGVAGNAGDPRNFVRGADDQAAPSAISPTQQAREGDYWVGPIPGVNHQKIVLMRHIPDIGTAEATRRVQALAAILSRRSA